MKRNEMVERIQKLEERIFLIKMADRLNRADWEMLEKLEKEIKELKEKL